MKIASHITKYWWPWRTENHGRWTCWKVTRAQHRPALPELAKVITSSSVHWARITGTSSAGWTPKNTVTDLMYPYIGDGNMITNNICLKPGTKLRTCRLPDCGLVVCNLCNNVIHVSSHGKLSVMGSVLTLRTKMGTTRYNDSRRFINNIYIYIQCMYIYIYTYTLLYTVYTRIFVPINYMGYGHPARNEKPQKMV